MKDGKSKEGKDIENERKSVVSSAGAAGQTGEGQLTPIPPKLPRKSCIIIIFRSCLGFVCSCSLLHLLNALKAADGALGYSDDDIF